MKTTILLWLLPLFGLCQQTAFFETTIYFEDAVGNRDSIIVGNDIDANIEFNPQFGEEDINTPYDSVFEVRAEHNLDVSFQIQSKKIIGSAEAFDPTYNCLLAVEPISFYVHAKYQPITVSWNRSHFNNSYCRTGTIFTSHLLPLVDIFWADIPEFLELSSCMAEDSTYSTYLFSLGGTGFYRLEEIEGIGQDTVFGLLLTFTQQGSLISPCTATVIVGTTETYHEDVKVYPNPTSDELYIEKEITENYVMWDAYGRLVITGKENPADMGGLPHGIYYLKLGNVVKKIVKY